MKTLYLLRHAKSSWTDAALQDRDRSLSTRGRRDAPAMGRYMMQQSLRPDTIYCSPAKRTRETLKRLTQDWDTVPPVHLEDGLYEFGAGASYLEILRTAARGDESIMLVGHNPSTEMMAAHLAGGGDAQAIEKMAAKYPTCALAVLTFETARWGDIREGSGTLERFILPRELPD